MNIFTFNMAGLYDMCLYVKNIPGLYDMDNLNLNIYYLTLPRQI